MKKLNILFVHPLIGNAYELYKVFERDVSVNIIPLLDDKEIKDNSLYKRLRYKLKIPIDSYEVNDKLLDYDFTNIDVLFVVKSNEIYPSTLKHIRNSNPNIKTVNWSLDDMSSWHTKSLYFHLAFKEYDYAFTTKKYNMDLLKNMGAKKTIYLNQAYSKDIHKKYDNCLETIDVLFIGRAEQERFKSMNYLASNGIIIHVYGTGWDKKHYQNIPKYLKIYNSPLYGEKYSRTISCSKITLGFLSKINQDQYTSRSIEIPACGGLLVAERTQKHLELFEEDREAVYFDNDEELLEKITYYLGHEDERKQISKNGYRRCLNSGYSYDDMAKRILKEINDEI